jgi:ElaB/YqjD/DUF883 family membrane-anchored ribosome-binding protein
MNADGSNADSPKAKSDSDATKDHAAASSNVKSKKSRDREIEEAGDDESIFDGAGLSEIGDRFVDKVRERPYAAVATALGAGVLLGSVLSSRIGRIAIFAAGGYAVKELFGDRLLEIMQGEEADSERFERAPSRGR